MERDPAWRREPDSLTLTSSVVQPGDVDARLRLVVITDADQARPRSIAQVVHAALKAGCRCVQLRDKAASARDLVEAATVLRSLTRRFDALLIVNDRFDVALAADADGVHVGPDDLPVAAIRRSVPPSFVIGASCDTPDEARALAQAGANYLGCGTVYPTLTKPDAGTAIGVSRIAAIARAVNCPIVAIGGITLANVGELSTSGAQGIAVVGAVMAAPDPGEATRRLLEGFSPR